MPQNQPRTPIVIVGLGLSGQACLEMLLRSGIPRTEIFTHDKKSPCDLPAEADVFGAKPATLVVSPGVPLRQQWIQNLIRAGTTVSSELELAFQHLTTEKVVGITGSVGKSTVTSVLAAGLKQAGVSHFVGGNLGYPLAHYVRDRLLDKIPAVEYVVLELSSYQLENFASLKCESSILTSLTANHMERYDSISEYYETKFTLITKTTGQKFFNASGLDLLNYRPRFTSLQSVWTDRNDPKLADVDFGKMKMVGRHNQDNVAMAWRWGQAHGMKPAYFEGLLNFPGLSHRLENLGETKGVLFLNDSKATTMASVLQAVDSIADLANTRKITYLLLGGRDKNLPWEQLAVLAKTSKLKFVFFGECADLAQSKSSLPGPRYPKLAEALNALLPQTERDDMVVLSPGGTSLDEFKSFEERGDYFRIRISQPSGDPHQHSARD